MILACAEPSINLSGDKMRLAALLLVPRWVRPRLDAPASGRLLLSEGLAERAAERTAHERRDLDEHSLSRQLLNRPQFS